MNGDASATSLPSTMPALSPGRLSAFRCCQPTFSACYPSRGVKNEENIAIVGVSRVSGTTFIGVFRHGFSHSLCVADVSANSREVRMSGPAAYAASMVVGWSTIR
jgi:hypothetical protein